MTYNSNALLKCILQYCNWQCRQYCLAVSVHSLILSTSFQSASYPSLEHYWKLLNCYHTLLVSTLKNLNSKTNLPSENYPHQQILHSAPMEVLHICVVIDFASGVGNTGLDPAKRQQQIRSAINICKFFSLLQSLLPKLQAEINLNIPHKVHNFFKCNKIVTSGKLS